MTGRRKNPPIPEHLRDFEDALDWALSGQAKTGGAFDEFYLDGFPLEIKSYEDAFFYVEDYRNDASLYQLEREDRHKFGRVKGVLRVIELAKMYIQRMLDYETADEITLYRTVLVPDVHAIRFDGVGVYWAYDSYGANAYFDEYAYSDAEERGEDVDAEDFKEIMLTGITHPNSIDWEAGFLAFLIMGEDEAEVRLLENAPILIVEIDDELLNPPVEAWA